MKAWFKLIVIILFITGIESCKNNDNVFKKQVSSFVKVINASSNAVNFYVNGTRTNYGSVFTPGGSSLYYIVPTGIQNLAFKLNNNPDVLFGLTDTLRDSAFTSLYYIGNGNNTIYKTTDINIPRNDPDTLTEVRFVHLAPDAGNLDVYIGDTVNFKATVFKTTSAYKTFGAGSKKIKVYLAGADTSISTNKKLDTTIAISANHIYTLFTYGLLNGTKGSKFGINITLNY